MPLSPAEETLRRFGLGNDGQPLGTIGTGYQPPATGPGWGGQPLTTGTTNNPLGREGQPPAGNGLTNPLANNGGLGYGPGSGPPPPPGPTTNPTTNPPPPPPPGGTTTGTGLTNPLSQGDSGSNNSIYRSGPYVTGGTPSTKSLGTGPTAGQGLNQGNNPLGRGALPSIATNPLAGQTSAGQPKSGNTGNPTGQAANINNNPLIRKPGVEDGTARPGQSNKINTDENGLLTLPDGSRLQGRHDPRIWGTAGNLGAMGLVGQGEQRDSRYWVGTVHHEESGDWTEWRLRPDVIQRLNGRVQIPQGGVGGWSEVKDPSKVTYDPEFGFLTTPDNINPLDSANATRWGQFWMAVVGAAVFAGAAATGGFDPSQGFGANPTNPPGGLPTTGTSSTGAGPSGGTPEPGGGLTNPLANTGVPPAGAPGSTGSPIPGAVPQGTITVTPPPGYIPPGAGTPVVPPVVIPSGSPGPGPTNNTTNTNNNTNNDNGNNNQENNDPNKKPTTPPPAGKEWWWDGAKWILKAIGGALVGALLNGGNPLGRGSLIGNGLALGDANHNNNAYNDDVNNAVNRADWNQDYRPRYANQLNNLMFNPDEALNQDGYKAMKEHRLGDLSRLLNARGFNISGNELGDLTKLATQLDWEQVQKERDAFMRAAALGDPSGAARIDANRADNNYRFRNNRSAGPGAALLNGLINSTWGGKTVSEWINQWLSGDDNIPSEVESLLTDAARRNGQTVDDFINDYVSNFNGSQIDYGFDYYTDYNNDGSIDSDDYEYFFNYGGGVYDDY